MRIQYLSKDGMQEHSIELEKSIYDVLQKVTGNRAGNWIQTAANAIEDEQLDVRGRNERVRWQIHSLIGPHLPDF